MDTETRQLIIPTLIPSRYWTGTSGDPEAHDRDHWSSDTVIVTPSGKRHKIGYIGPRGVGRRVDQGPILPGPFAYAFGLGVAITANPAHSTAAESQRLRKTGLEHTVHDGDLVVFPGVAFRVRIVRNDWIELDHDENL